jgi:hypothetical protein
MADGGACAFKVAKTERRFMLQALVDNSRSDQWRPVALAVNWEDNSLRCDATGELIESAYGDWGAEESDGRDTAIDTQGYSL